MGLRSLLAVALVVWMLPTVAVGQSVRGVVTDRATGAQLGGVVVILVDESGQEIARTLTSETGEYRLGAPSAGRYRLRTLRIGFRPVTSESVTLLGTEERSQSLALLGVPFMLDTVTVARRAACDVRPDSAKATFAVWEQVRTALSAAQLTASNRALRTRVVVYDRTLEPVRERVVQHNASVKEGLTSRPWNSLSADSFHRVGYVQTGIDGNITYYAPDIPALLSNEFTTDHCLRLVRGEDGVQVGIEFEPTHARRNVPEIRGTLWLDRRSNELRMMQFRYVNVTREQSFGRSGGDIHFARMSSGAFVISGWNIRMPQLDTRVVPRAGVRLGGATDVETYVRALRVEGGELAMVTRAADTIWSRPPSVLSGRVRDSLSGTAIASARVGLQGTRLWSSTDAKGEFRIVDVLPGEYVLNIVTPELDRLGTSHPVTVMFTDGRESIDVRAPGADMIRASLCPGRVEGIVVGSISLSGDSLPPYGTKVVAAWSEPAVLPAREASSQQRNRWIETRTDATGRYRLCGVPRESSLSVRVEHDSATAPAVNVILEGGEHVARADIVMHRGRSSGAVLTGIVMNAGNGQPLADVEVALAGLDHPAFTNADGAFRIADIPPGRYAVTARRVGYRMHADSMSFAANQSIHRPIVLATVGVLDTVSVVETYAPASFEEHRRLGLGVFFTRADLARLEHVTMGGIFGRVPTAFVVRSAGSAVYVASSRGREQRSGEPAPGHGATDYVVPACYSQVYLDNHPMYSGKPNDQLFNINSISPDRIEAIEYYPTESGMPVKYLGPYSRCGVLVIHTRRSK